MRSKASCGCIVFALAICARAAVPVVATDLLRMKEVVDVAAARDGSFAVYGVRSIATAEMGAKHASEPQYSYQNHLWMIDLRDAEARPVQLTFDTNRDTAPTISPDGSELAFVRQSQGNPTPQVWLMPLSQPGEARQITDLEFGAVDPKWQPDGRALLVSSAIPISRLPGKPPFAEGRPNRDWWDSSRPEPSKTLDARPDGNWAEIRTWLDENARQHNPEDILRMDFLGEQGLAGERRFTELFTVTVKPHRSVSRQITQTYLDHSDARWSADGSQIVFAAQRTSDESLPDEMQRRSCLWIVNRDGTKERLLLNDDRYNFSLPQFTSDGKHILALGAQSDEPTYRQAALVMCDPDGARPDWVTPASEPSVQQPQTIDDKAYYTVNFEGGQHLRAIDLKSKEVKDIIGGPVGVNVFAVAPGKIVYGLISVPDPSELYLSAGVREQAIDPARDSAAKGNVKHHQRIPLKPLFDRAPVTRRLTQLNAGWLEEKELSLPEEHWIRRPDGTRVQYWLMKPTHFDASKKYPWVVEVHGGPAAMWGPGEFSMWHEFQTLCSFGFGVLYANPRGSAGYGYPFERGNYQDWGDGPMGDVLAAFDDASMGEPAIDHRRVFLTGGSYGGYLVAWTVAHDHRFKAAVAQRGVYDLATFFGEGNAYRLVPEEFGGYPWDPDTRRILQQQSPITYVAQIETPLLILHGSDDDRTGVVQGQMLFRALKELHRPVEYVRYPGAGHELTRSGPPKQRMDHLLRIVEFFERYADNDRPAPTAPEAE